jgi:hypothetical protein
MIHVLVFEQKRQNVRKQYPVQNFSEICFVLLGSPYSVAASSPIKKTDVFAPI